MSVPRCEAFRAGGDAFSRCTRPASVDRDGHRACIQHGKLQYVRWSPIDFGGEVDRHRPWWEVEVSRS